MDPVKTALRRLRKENRLPTLAQEASVSGEPYLGPLETDFEERAAILEFEAGFSREEAEARAGLRHNNNSYNAGEGGR